VGRELARLLALPFYDLDALIEERTGQSVRSLYIAGPELFRQAEEAALNALLLLPENGILAAGGGITDNPGALALLRKADVQGGSVHTIVYLDVPAQTAWQRIANAGELPPFLRAETIEASMEKHRMLHQRRSDACREIARFCVFAGTKPPVELAEEILSKTAGI